VHNVEAKDALELTIAELSARTGVPITTLRMYQQRRLLDPPTRRGRVGYYDHSHLERLRLIATLQERGYSLAGIGDVLSNPDVLSSLLNVAVPALRDDGPITLTLPELLGRLPAVDFSFDLVQRAQALDLIEVVPAGIVIKQPSFLDVGSALITMGVPGRVVLDAYERLHRQLGEVADDFVAVYDEHIADGDVPEDLETAAAQLEALTRAAVDVVVNELRRSLRIRAETRLAALGVS
jgi:DNA-binding transcriptional MerR regulator